MPHATSITVLDSAGATQTVATLDAVLAVTPAALGQGTMAQSTPVAIASNQSDLPVKPGAAETKITAAAMPSGGVGFLGWLSAIWYLLSTLLPAALGAGGGLKVEGNQAAGVAIAGNPALIGGNGSSTAPTAVTAGQRQNQWLSLNGATMMAGYGIGGSDGVSNAGILSMLNSAGAALNPVAAAPFTFNGTSWDRNVKPNLTSRIASAAATTNPTVGKASPGNLHKVFGDTVRASVVYLKLYNKASAPIVGTDTIVMTIPLPASARFDIEISNLGFYFSIGIAYALTPDATDTGTTALAAGDILGLTMLMS